MSTITPQEVKTIAESLTGMKTQGIVEKQAHVKGEAYKVNVSEGFLVCLKESNGWLITLFGKDNVAISVWRNSPIAEAKIGIQIIDMFINVNNKSVNPVFEKEFMDTRNDIQRKTYQSEIGPIVLHSRRHPLGSEGVVQVINQKLILTYIWERATGMIQNEQYVSKLPF